MSETIQEILQGDCLELMPALGSGVVHCVMSDLPYGTTYAPWDSVLPLDRLWAEWKRMLVPGGAVVLTSSQPFTSTLVMSNPKWFRCEWVWDKVNGANFANANRQPLKTHESVLVFCERQPFYSPQKTVGARNHVQGKSTVNASETRLINERVADDLSGMKFPKSIQVFPKHSSQCGLHPTQKPVDLMRYFVTPSMKTVIHVNQHAIRRNRKTGERKPVLTVKTYKSNRYAHEVETQGPSKAVYPPDHPPVLRCSLLDRNRK